MIICISFKLFKKFVSYFGDISENKYMENDNIIENSEIIRKLLEMMSNNSLEKLSLLTSENKILVINLFNIYIHVMLLKNLFCSCNL